MKFVQCKLGESGGDGSSSVMAAGEGGRGECIHVLLVSLLGKETPRIIILEMTHVRLLERHTTSG